MKDDLEIGCLVSRSLSERSDGEIILGSVKKVIPTAMPGRYGNYEPLSNEYEEGGLGHALESWLNPFLWQRSRPRVSGDVWFGKGLRHSSHHMTLESKRFNLNQVVHYLREVSKVLGADMAYFHLFSKIELTNRENYEKVMSFRRGICTTDLNEGIPDLPSLAIFGRPYIELFGVDRLLSAPGAAVERIADELVLIQVCDDVRASQTDYPEFEKRRQAIKEHLGMDAFLEPGRRSRVPEFSFS